MATFWSTLQARLTDRLLKKAWDENRLSAALADEAKLVKFGTDFAGFTKETLSYCRECKWAKV